ncbi:translin-like [Haliotis rufescens]|uniref:translin-like n=1 Tax=Haliotis rufescens TaxID=6454 RepID=UPI001EB0160C|nr:translin-like [Haliotis rufescens]
MTQDATSQIFSSFQDYINEEQEIREDIRSQVKDIEQTAREIQTLLQSVHQQDGIKGIPTLCEKARERFERVREQFSNLSKKVPQDQYYRFHDHWRFVSQRLTGLSAYIVYLEKEALISREDSAAMLGVKMQRGEGFHIDLDDYLMGLLQLASELSRLAVNSVTAGDYGRPVRIARFVGELDSGFRLLNLKNDSLRKRFDALKYDLKKSEEVVYDLTIRGLVPQEQKSTHKPSE